MVTQQDLDFILDRQVRELYNILVTSYSLCIDIQTSTLIINISESTAIAELEGAEEIIGRAAYLKLGCKKVSFYCCQNWLWDYNAHITDQFDNMTAAVLSSPTETQESDYLPLPQQQQPMAAIDWISFDGIAQNLGVARDIVSQEVEAYGIFVTLHSNNLGLSGDNVEAYLDRRHTHEKLRFRRILAPDAASATKAPKTKLQAVPDVKPPLTFTPTADGGLGLPESFDMMAGRKRRPDILTGLKIAIAALPDGETEDIKKMYVRQIAMRENVDNFVGALASQFQGSAKFKSVAQTSKEIYNAARQLWDEYLDSTPA